MTQVGEGDYRYELRQDFLKPPPGEKFGLVSRVATNSQDRVYVFQRKDPPVVVFDRDGKYLGAWGSGEVTDPHGLKIVDDIVYTTDRIRLGREIVYPGRQALDGTRPARRAFRHRRRSRLARDARPGRSTTRPR